MAQPMRLLVFGDQTVEIVPSLLELSAYSLRSPLLSRFFRLVDDGVKAEISRTPLVEDSPFATFNSVIELINLQTKTPNAAVRTLLLCIAQLGNLLLLSEKEPEILSSSSDITSLGICTGSVAGLAVLYSTSTEQLLSVVPAIARISLCLGFAAQERADTIEKSQYTWALMVFGLSEDEVGDLIADHAKTNLLSPDQRLYISSRADNSTTISGAPSSIQSFVAQKLADSVNRTELPLNAPFHAAHLPIPDTGFITSLADLLPSPSSNKRYVISPATGKPHIGSTNIEILSEITRDILERPLDWSLLTTGLLSTITGEVILTPIGPTNTTKYFQKILTAAGVQHSTQIVLNTSQNAKVSLHDEHADDDIAIVGMSGRFPEADTLEEFWQVLEEGRDLHRKVPHDRFDINTHFDPTGKIPNTMLTPYGVFMDNPGHFDARMFNMSPREAAQTCPMQRLLLLTTYEALEMSGYQLNRTPSTNSERIGSFFGQTSDDWREVNASQNVDTFFITGGIRAFGPGRTNYYFKWEGPSYSVDTACSSSAASIQLACTALLAHEVDTAVAGGANILTASDLFSGLSRGGFLSSTGGCKTFDDAADGYCRGDAVGVVVLKRLSDAIADNDNILSVIKSVATNHSADAISITHPHSATQQKLFRKVVSKSGLSPNDIDYVELHGTGTQAGDFTEFSSITGVFAQDRPLDRPLYIGTVKPNLGHGEAASGVTSLIKAIMMLQQNTIPPHVGIKGKINHRLPSMEPMGVRLAMNPVNWPSLKERRRRIVINNFDAAGGNTSMLIEDPPVRILSGSDPRTSHVVTISGRTPNSLRMNKLRLLEFLKTTPIDLSDLAYTTTARRQHHGYRASYTCSRIHELLNTIDKDVSATQEPQRASKGPVVFAFTGQGSQFSGMGNQLYTTNKYCRRLFQEYDAICVRQSLPSFLKLIANKACDINAATPAEIQLAIVSLELVIAKLWQSWGVIPDMVIGHSLGEYPAMVVSGVITVSEMLYLVGKRALLMQAKCTEGTHSMLAVKLSADQTVEVLNRLPELACEIACINGPDSTVVSGTKTSVAALQQNLQLNGTKSSMLDVRFAFHSAQMDDVLPSFALIAESIQYQAPKIPFASPLRGFAVKEAGVINAKYLAEQCRRTVDFVKALNVVRSEFRAVNETLWIDLGPQPFCLRMAQGTLDIPSPNLIATSKKGIDNWTTISEGLSAAYNMGVDIRWNSFHKEYEASLRLLNLPSYAFDLKNYWLQYEGDWSITKGQKATATTSVSVLPSFKATPSLQRVESEKVTEDATTVVFASNLADPQLRAAIRGHLVNGVGLCPSSIYADMALSSGSYIHNKLHPETELPAMQVTDMEVFKPLIAHAREGVDQWLYITAQSSGEGRDLIVTYSSTEDGSTTDHARCFLQFGDGKQWLSKWSRNAYLINGRIEKLIDGAENGRTHKILKRMVYKLFSVLVAYGPKYQGLEKVYLDSEALEATGFVKFQTTSAEENFFFSPYWIDSILHISGFVLNGSDATPDDIVYISHGWKALSVVKPLTSTGKYAVYVRMQPTDAKGVLAGDVYVMEDENIVLVCTGLKFQQIKRALLSRVLQPQVEASNRRHISPLREVKAPPREMVPTKHLPIRSIPNVFDVVLSTIATEAEVALSEFVDSAHLSELGVDSLLALGIVDKLRQIVTIPIPSSIFIEYPTVGSLRAFLNTSTGASSTQDEEQSDESEAFAGGSSPNSSNVSVVDDDENKREPLHQALKAILVDELGIQESEVQLSTSFEEIGVDSLMTSILISEIRRSTGEVVPSTFFFEHPTFGDVVRLDSPSRVQPATLKQTTTVVRTLQKDKKATTNTPLTQLESNAALLQGIPQSSPAVFLFPDGSGSASSYTSLPPLSASTPVYGLNSPYVSSPTSFTASETIESTATIYIAAIRKEQPKGPYILGGWSIGGVYAYEAARQLTLAGEKVSGVILIDAPCPKVLPPMSLDTIDVLEELGIFSKVAKDGKGIPKNIRDHFHASIRALKVYNPQELPKDSQTIPTVAIWARDGVLERVSQSSLANNTKFGGDDNPTRDWLLKKRGDQAGNGWEELLGKVRVRTVVGNHFTMMRQPAIQELAKVIAEELERLV